MPKQPIKVLIADDHALVRMGLAAILETSPDIHVVGDAEDGRDAVAKTRTLKPDVVLMDVVMPEMDGATATAEILAALPQTKVVILTSFVEADGIARAIRAGARGALLKTIDHRELAEAIRRVVAGEEVVSPEIRKTLSESASVQPLTERQRDVLLSMARGLTDADIARQLDISANSVREHVTTIYAKLGAANRAEAIAIAYRKHLLSS